MKKLSHIELFAGCGGMSLGLETSGFELYFANELSPMAGETFSYNLMGEDLRKLADIGQPAENVLWIKSSYEKTDLRNRLRENPFTFEKGKHFDLDKKTDLAGKLLIGNIDHLLNFLAHNKSICQHLRNQDIDLVSGGPPCQSFSLAGRREKDNHKNLLPLSFARFAGLIKPKMVLLENVKGITSAFTVGDKKYYAWLEVAKAFCLEGFVPICMMVNSKFFGIPQNRPRFILLALRKDICRELLKVKLEQASIDILTSSFNFFNIVQENKKSLDFVSKKDLRLYDIEKEPHLFNGQLLPLIITTKENFVSSKEAIDDLSVNNNYVLEGIKPSSYVVNLNEIFKQKDNSRSYELTNHELRKHSFGVKARFRWFQLVSSNLNGLAPHALRLLAGKHVSDEKLSLIFEKVQGEEVLIKQIKDEALVKLNRQNFGDFIKSIQTKKHSQRALRATEPAPAQLTIPDDLCHYSQTQLRTLTVREMARFQSFPDWFQFKSKVTTGGDQRSFEVPQYTQVGNAVPPLLAYELGKTVSRLLTRLKNG
ncbi:DNA cytosine methyltransferase [Flavisolibacter sp. BT320]|nr:DNA cytosine methyltransferase [Flavisolibacter longurius]